MNSPVSFVRTSDLVRIAYTEAGEGPALVSMPPVPFNHLELEWDSPELRHWHERLARSVRLIRYDARGTGLSDHEPLDLSLEAQVADLDAVIAKVGGPVTLFAQFFASPVAFAYAARHPDAVAGIVVWAGFVKGTDFAADREIAAIVSLLDKDWVLFTETLAHAHLGWELGPPAQSFAFFLRSILTPERMRDVMTQQFNLDATGQMEDVRAPSLVLHRRDLPFFSISQAQHLAASLSRGQLQLLDGNASAPFLGDSEGVADALLEFVATVSGVRRGSPGVVEALAEPLTPREVAILELISRGRSNNDIARELVISVATVKTHLNNLYGKLRVGTRTQALHRGRELGILD